MDGWRVITDNEIINKAILEFLEKKEVEVNFFKNDGYYVYLDNRMKYAEFGRKGLYDDLKHRGGTPTLQEFFELFPTPKAYDGREFRVKTPTIEVAQMFICLGKKIGRRIRGLHPKKTDYVHLSTESNGTYIDFNSGSPLGKEVSIDDALRILGGEDVTVS